jgi:hypothetical protein
MCVCVCVCVCVLCVCVYTCVCEYVHIYPQRLNDPKNIAMRLPIDPKVGLYPRGRVQEEKAWGELVCMYVCMYVSMHGRIRGDAFKKNSGVGRADMCMYA